MKDPHTNSHPTQGSSSPSDPHSKEAQAQRVPNDKEPASKALPIELADRSALISFVQEEAKRIPDIRQDRIEQIREALKSGKYHISNDLLANKIIQDILLDEHSAQD